MCSLPTLRVEVILPCNADRKEHNRRHAHQHPRQQKRESGPGIPHAKPHPENRRRRRRRHHQAQRVEQRHHRVQHARARRPGQRRQQAVEAGARHGVERGQRKKRQDDGERAREADAKRGHSRQQHGVARNLRVLDNGRQPEMVEQLAEERHDGHHERETGKGLDGAEEIGLWLLGGSCW